MKRVLMAGNVACGKTTLCQRLNGLKMDYKKTQTLEVINKTIDTPGEYLERRSLFHALTVTAAEADQAIFLQDASQERFLFSPGQSAALPIPVAGVVTKIDAASPERVKWAEEVLELAGASPIFKISAKTGEGIDELMEFLKSDEDEPAPR